METSPLICGANQGTGFYMITASVMKELTFPPKTQQDYEGNLKFCPKVKKHENNEKKLG